MNDDHYYDDEIRGKVYDHRLMKRILAYAKPYVRWLVPAVALLLAASALELLWPQFVRMAVDRYVENDRLTKAEKVHGVLVLGLWYLGTLLLSVALRYVQIWITNLIGQSVMHDIRMDLFSRVERLSPAFFSRNPVGRLVTRVTNDVAQLNEIFTTGIVGIFGDVLMLVGIVVVMLMMDVELSLLSFAVLPFVALAVALFRAHIRPAYLAVRKYLAQINAYLQEHISGIKVVQAFNHEAASAHRFDELNREHLLANIRIIKIHGVFMPAVEALSYLATSLLLYFGARLIYDGTIQIGTLMAFLLYSKRFFRPINDLSQKYNILQSAMTSSQRIFALMDSTDRIEEPAAVPDGLPERVEGLVEFRNVWFAYEGENWVLRDVSLTVRPGEKVALVGITGSGKTTIVNLLSRFYDVQKGSVLLDGVDVRQYPTGLLRRQMAYVQQDFFIFSGTILGNIKLWSPDIPDADAVAAARIVNVHTFAEKLPRAFHEPILERGSNLSTGQKQLISFARALAFKPRILILDEATSSIDSETEKLVQDALDKLLARQTSIIIAHRLSTIRSVDRIVVVHKGRIAEEGSHDDLLGRGGIYASLYALQFRDLADAG